MMSPTKLDTVSKLVIDLGKILFAAAVVGFFIPGFSGEVGLLTFVFGAATSVTLFFIGIKLTG